MKPQPMPLTPCSTLIVLLLRQTGGTTGRQISKFLKRSGCWFSGYGWTYSLLRKMEEAGWIEWYDSDFIGDDHVPRARTYILTQTGKALMNTHIKVTT